MKRSATIGVYDVVLSESRLRAPVTPWKRCDREVVDPS